MLTYLQLKTEDNIADGSNGRARIDGALVGRGVRRSEGQRIIFVVLRLSWDEDDKYVNECKSVTRRTSNVDISDAN